jgi:RNA polymerase sigma-70 factor (ECF subfamily)
MDTNQESEDRNFVSAFLRDRDETSFRALYRRHTPALFALALRLVGGVPQDAEDVVQETWLRAVRRLSEFRWQSSLRTWLCGITINCTRDLRPKLSLIKVSEPVLHAQEPESQTELEQLIQRLPAGCREVLVLHDIEGYTHQEIGRHLGIQEGTSKSQLFQARRLLRDQLHREPEVSEKGGKS